MRRVALNGAAISKSSGFSETMVIEWDSSHEESSGKLAEEVKAKVSQQRSLQAAAGRA